MLWTSRIWTFRKNTNKQKGRDKHFSLSRPFFRNEVWKHLFGPCAPYDLNELPGAFCNDVSIAFADGLYVNKVSADTESRGCPQGGEASLTALCGH